MNVWSKEYRKFDHLYDKYCEVLELLSLSYHSFVITVEVLLKAAGDAPIMVKKKWTVDGSKQVAYIVEFIRKYIKCEPKDSLVSITRNDVTWTTFSIQLWCNDFAFATHKWVVGYVAAYQCSTRFVA